MRDVCPSCDPEINIANLAWSADCQLWAQYVRRMQPEGEQIQISGSYDRIDRRAATVLNDEALIFIQTCLDF